MELKSFSSLDNYFALFMKNKDSMELLFELLAGLPDELPVVSDDATKKSPGTNTSSSVATNSSTS